MATEKLTCPHCGATVGTTASTNKKVATHTTLFHDCPEAPGAAVSAAPERPQTPSLGAIASH
jgi:hypothetical protein